MKVFEVLFQPRSLKCCAESALASLSGDGQSRNVKQLAKLREHRGNAITICFRGIFWLLLRRSPIVRRRGFSHCGSHTVGVVEMESISIPFVVSVVLFRARHLD